MSQLLFFALLSIPVIIISRKTLMIPKSHGFYRFLGLEGLLWVLSCNSQYWFKDPFCVRQIISWLLLILSVCYVVAGSILLAGKGKPQKGRDDDTLHGFEKTTELVETGLYKYIRHPLYGSLIFLTWGTCLKNAALLPMIVSAASTVFFYLTARFDEKECIRYFGKKYSLYMTRSKMFVPFIF